MQEEKNNPVFLRPRFQIDVTETKQELLEKFREAFAKSECKFKGKIVDHHIVIDIPKNENHFWSPQLHLEVVSEDAKTILKGLFGPKPQVWTLFMFLHFGVAVIFIGFLILAYTQWSLKTNYTSSVVVLIVLPLLWFLMYFLGRLGKKTGHGQMQELHDFMEETIEN